MHVKTKSDANLAVDTVNIVLARDSSLMHDATLCSNFALIVLYFVERE